MAFTFENTFAAAGREPSGFAPFIRHSSDSMSRTTTSALLCLCMFLLSANYSFCQSDKISNFERDIAPILLDKCVSCHEGDKAKNGFVVSDRDALLGYLAPGNSAESSLWTDYLVQPSRAESKESLVMPPDGPLNPSQLAMVKLWIDEGADWPVGFLLTSKDEKEEKPAGNISFTTKAFKAIGYFHPAMVHFPIALFLVGGVCAFLSYFLGPRCQTTAFQCVAVAAVSCVITVIMGWSFADTRGYPAWDKMLATNATHDETNLFFHRWLGTLTAVVGIVCVVVGLMARRYKSNKLSHAWRIGAIVLAALVGLVGHQGGELVYGDIFDKALEQLRK